MGRQPTAEEISEDTGLTYSEALETLTWISEQYVELDAPESEDIADEGPGVEDIVDDELRSQAIAAALQLLSPTHRAVIELRFGLEDGRVWTTREVGNKVGLTHTRVAQIEREALRALRAHPIARKLLSDWK